MIEIYEEDYLTVDPMKDDDEQLQLKEAILSLRPVERRIFLTYTEAGTYSETARQFNVSVPTAKRYINEVRDKIINKITNYDNDDVEFTPYPSYSGGSVSFRVH